MSVVSTSRFIEQEMFALSVDASVVSISRFK